MENESAVLPESEDRKSCYQRSRSIQHKKGCFQLGNNLSSAKFAAILSLGNSKALKDGVGYSLTSSSKFKPSMSTKPSPFLKATKNSSVF